MTKKIIIVGAGITGLLAAYYLAKENYQITVIEQESYPAMKTSFANGGQVSVSNSEVWNTWSNVQKGLKWMFVKDAPLLIRPSLDYNQWSWLFKFLKNISESNYIKNTSDTIKLGLESKTLYDKISEEENIKFDRSDCGILHFYKDRNYYNNAIKAKELYNINGCEWELLDNDLKVKNIEPTLNDVNGIIGGAWTPGDWVGDIHKFCWELYKILETKYQVKFQYNSAVNILNILDSADAIVVSAGTGSVKIAKQVGDNLPIYPVKGYSITINDVDSRLLPKVSLLDDQSKIVSSTLGNRLRVAGTAEFAGENWDITRSRIEPLLKWVHENFPNINTRNYSQWACLRPMTPNMMPIIEPSKKNSRVFYHTGHGHLGFTLAPATSQQLVDLIKG